ncbi:hypothetical protein [Arthrobacter sp. MMS24-S77]
MRKTGSPGSLRDRVIEPEPRRVTPENPVPDDGPASGASSPADALNATEAPITLPRSTFLPRLTLGKRLQSASAASSPPVRAAEPAAASSMRTRLDKRTPPGKDSKGSVETLAALGSESVPPQDARPRHVLRLRGTPSPNATTRPAPAQATQHQAPPANATPPNAAPPNAAPPNAIRAQPPTTPLRRPPEAVAAVVVPAVVVPAVVVGLKNAEHQSHPSTSPDRTPAAPITGNWPELAPRPAPQPAAETLATAAMARAARLSNEQLAI